MRKETAKLNYILLVVMAIKLSHMVGLSVITFTKSFSVITSTHHAYFAPPLLKLMFQWHVTLHEQVEELTTHCSLGEPIGSHVSRVNPKEIHQDALIKELS